MTKRKAQTMQKLLLALELGPDYTMKLERLADLMSCEDRAKFAGLLVARSLDELEEDIQKWIFVRSDYDYILRNKGYVLEISPELHASKIDDYDDGIPF
ncbi:MAG: hypothetical protein ACEPO2_02010 [Pelagibaca sp.]